VLLVGFAVAAGFILGSLSGRDTSTKVHTYTGTVEAICGGGAVGGVTKCFAVRPDTGTAHEDGYYAGAGDVSFGPPPSDGVQPYIGDHVTVTVVTVRGVDVGYGVVGVSADPA
jgi:hypothetical protein